MYFVENKKSIFYSIISIIISLLILFICSKIFPNTNIYSIYSGLVYIFPLLFTLILIRKFSLTEKLIKKRLDFKFLILKSWYLIFASIFFFTINLIFLNRERAFHLKEFIFFIVFVFLNIIFEEFLFRGLVQNLLIKNSKSDSKRVWNCIIVSSIFFGLVHLINLIGQPQLIYSTISQVIYAFSLGVFLGVIYFLSDNIISSIVLHFFFNFFGSFSSLFASSLNVTKDLNLTEALIQIVIIFPIFFIGKRLFKKSYI